MRRVNREVSDPQLQLEILRRCHVCRIALNDSEVGSPYILPLNFALAEKDGHPVLYFHGAGEGRKYELLAQDSRCSFEADCDHALVSDESTAYCTFQYSSVIGHGRLSVVPDGEKFAALQAINNASHPGGFPVNEASVARTTVMRLDVEAMTGKSNVGKIAPAAIANIKKSRYELLLKQLPAMLEGEADQTARYANAAAMIHEAFGFWWTGFYRVVPVAGAAAVAASGAYAFGSSGVSASSDAAGSASLGVSGHGGHGAKAGDTEELLLGPFQGPVACMHIGYGRGVCGTAWKENRTVVVPDVEQFPGHIACSSASRSEIVVPLRDPSGRVTAVLDIDSKDLGTFDELDAQYLEQLVGKI